MITTNRNQWMDVAKGLAIILMVIGHTPIPEMLSRFIYSFHMPLFFIASGWMTNWKKYTIKLFFIKKIKSLIFPFLIYSSIVLLLMNFENKGIINDWLIKGWQGYALWFIPVLFISLIFAYFFFLIPNKWTKIFTLFLILFLSFLLKYYSVSLPWSMSVVPYASFMIIAGSYLSKFNFIVNFPKYYILVFNFIITLSISYYWKLDMAWNNVTPIIPLTIAAISGTIMIFIFSSILVKYFPQKSQILQRIGKETYVVVAFSQIIIMLCNTYLPCPSLIKYSILVISLWLIIFIKSQTKHLIK